MSESENTAATIEQTELTEADLGSVVRDLIESIGTATLTMYQLHKVVNGALEVFGVEYRVRPQMMYNYNNNKMIVKGEKVDKVDKVQAAVFTTKFVGKRIK